LSVSQWSWTVVKRAESVSQSRISSNTQFSLFLRFSHSLTHLLTYSPTLSSCLLLTRTDYCWVERVAIDYSFSVSPPTWSYLHASFPHWQRSSANQYRSQDTTQHQQQHSTTDRQTYYPVVCLVVARCHPNRSWLSQWLNGRAAVSLNSARTMSPVRRDLWHAHCCRDILRWTSAAI